MSTHFLESYFGAFDRIEGWFSPDAALMFMAYHEVIAAHDVAGDLLEFPTGDVTAHGGGTIRIPVRVVNRSTIPFVAGPGAAQFGQSYHLLSDDGHEVQFNNARSYFARPLAPDEERIVDMAVDVPKARGSYTVEADIVWEGITWLKDRGLDTPSLRLVVV